VNDTVKQALTNGAPVNLSRRAMLLSKTNGNNDSIELSASRFAARRRKSGRSVLLH